MIRNILHVDIKACGQVNAFKLKATLITFMLSIKIQCHAPKFP